MIKIKKRGFTLSEVLITLSIIGALAALVLPGLIKDSMSKSNMALLQGTVSNLNNAVQTELTRSRVTDIENTQIVTNPVEFIQDYFEVAKVCTETDINDCYGSSYKTYNGANAGAIWTNEPVLLKNGVTIDILTNQRNEFVAMTLPEKYQISLIAKILMPAAFAEDTGMSPAIPPSEDTEMAEEKNYAIPVSIDLNGPKNPNISGVDRQVVCIYTITDADKGYHAGDVGGCLRSGLLSKTTTEELKTACKSGYTEACYLVIEQSGFDYKALEN